MQWAKRQIFFQTSITACNFAVLLTKGTYSTFLKRSNAQKHNSIFLSQKNLIFITFILPSDVDFHLWKVHNNRFSYHNMFFSGFFNVCLKCHPYMKLYLQEHDCGISWWGRLNSIDFYSVMNMFKGFFCILSYQMIEGLRSWKIGQVLSCLFLRLGTN